MCSYHPPPPPRLSTGWLSGRQNISWKIGPPPPPNKKVANHPLPPPHPLRYSPAGWVATKYFLTDCPPPPLVAGWIRHCINHFLIIGPFYWR